MTLDENRKSIYAERTMKTLTDVIKHFGKPVHLAKALGISTQAIAYWQSKKGLKGAIPIERAYQIEVLTNGVFKVDELRTHQRGYREAAAG